MALGESLLERDTETARLRTINARAVGGEGTAVVIEGAAGIGKSRLLAEAALAGQEHGARVVRARAGEMERSFAFGVVRQLFEPVLVRAGTEERARLLDGAAGLADPVFDPARVAGGAGQDAYPLLHGLFWLTANLARERPLVLCVDDAQWCDEPSLLFLEFLARRVADLPVVLLVATRPVQPRTAPSLVALVTDASTTMLRPAGLSRTATATLLQERLGATAEPGFVDACAEMTGGNPFLVGELVRLLDSEDVPPTAAMASRVSELAPLAIAENVLLRVARLPPEARALAEAIAVLGDTTDPRDAAALAGLGAEEATALAQRLVDVGVLADAGRWAFAHPVLRAAVYEHVGAAERERRHVEAARLLLREGRVAEQVAAHLLNVSRPVGPWAAAPLRAAAAHALAVGDVAAAQRYGTRALVEELSPADRSVVLVELGHAQAIGMDPAAVETLGTALATVVDAPELVTRAALDLALVLLFSGRIDAFVTVLTDAETAVAPHDAVLADRLRSSLLVASQISFGAAQRLADRLAAFEDPGGEVETPAELATLSAAAWRDVVGGRPIAGVRSMLERLEVAGGRVTDPQDALLGPMMFAAAMVLAERYEQVQDLAGRELALARERGSAFNAAAALALRSWASVRRGDLLAAETDAREALELLEAVGFASFSAAMAQATLLECAMETGAALGPLDVVLDAPAPDPDLGPNGLLVLARARALAHRGAPEAALTSLLAAGVGTYADASPSYLAWRSEAARMLADLGRTGEARALADEEVARARTSGAPAALGAALRVQGLLAPADAALALLEEAVQVLATSPARLAHAHALVDLGAHLRRGGRRAESRGPLREGHDMALACGASALAATARQELAASGERLAPQGLSGAQSLTASERRVATMAAEGRRNREIAQALFVTEKTVETHLSRAYGKLDIRSRGELARALGA